MAEFIFACQQCGEKLQVDDSLAGQVVECPTCKKGIVVPKKSSSYRNLAELAKVKLDKRPDESVRSTGRERRCPRCGVSNDVDRMSCWSCGKTLREELASSQKKPIEDKAVMPGAYGLIWAVAAFFEILGGLAFLVSLIMFTSGGVPLGLNCLGYAITLCMAGLLLFALCGIWHAVERTAVSMKRIEGFLDNSNKAQVHQD